jgi:hypothetical protein
MIAAKMKGVATLMRRPGLEREFDKAVLRSVG